MRHIDISELSRVIDAQPVEMPIMIIGDTGIGKTQVIKQYAKDNNMYLKTLILSQLEASEALGIPVQSTREYNGKIYNTIDTAIPAWVFDLAEHKNSILYLDEFLCAEPSVMNSFLNFITEREVSGIDLSHVKIIAATNIGNYTYDPDNNILSRFSMVYAENKNFSKYLSSKYKNAKTINNDYKDVEELEGAIFEERSLKPRCHELLCLVKDKDMLRLFYEGFTNKLMQPKFHNNSKINDTVAGFAKFDEDRHRWYIDSEDISALAGFLYKQVYNSKRKNLVDNVTEYKEIMYDKSALQQQLRFKLENF